MGNDSKDSLPKKNRESGTTSFLGNILTNCFLSTEFDFCIFVNDHFAGRKERGSGSGEGSQGQHPGQAAAKSLVSKFHISSLDTRRRGREMGGSFLSGESLVGWTLHPWHWHPWTWHLSSGGPGKNLKHWNTVASFSRSATVGCWDTLFRQNQVQHWLEPVNPRTIYVSNVISTAVKS